MRLSKTASSQPSLGVPSASTGALSVEAAVSKDDKVKLPSSLDSLGNQQRLEELGNSNYMQLMKENYELKKQNET